MIFLVVIIKIDVPPVRVGPTQTRTVPSVAETGALDKSQVLIQGATLGGEGPHEPGETIAAEQKEVFESGLCT